MPSEVTPARRGASPTAQSASFAFTKKGLPAKSIIEFGFSKWRLAGICLFSRASVALIRPATPAAASKWPRFDLSEPIAQKFLRCVVARNALVSALISMGSPTTVPVPCVSTYEMLSAKIPATPIASEMTSACPSTLGARKPILRAPSLLIAEPRMTA